MVAADSRVAVVVVSDTCVKDHTLDKTGPALISAIYSACLSTKVELKYVSDDTVAIQKIVKALVAEKYTAIFTAGGTGFASRDNTPEAIEPLLQRKASGLVVAMLHFGLSMTSLAALARPVAGTIDSTLIITLPGSPKGAVENFEAIASILPHALKLLEGADSRDLHRHSSTHRRYSSTNSSKSSNSSDVRLSTTSENGSSANASAIGRVHKEQNHEHEHEHHHIGHSHDHHHHNHHNHHHHHHHHHGHDSNHSGPVFFGPAFRHRQSPYPMIDFDEAVQIVADHAPTPEPIEVTLEESLGCVLSKDIVAPVNIPAFRASIVDGYAIFHTDCEHTDSIVLPVGNVSHAASALEFLAPHTCARITTGAPVPHGATAVVPVENTEVVEESNGEEVSVRIVASGVNPGDNIRGIGSDIAIGSLVLPRNTIISSLGGEVGVLATLGITRIPVFRKPVVGVLSTGDEVVDAGSGLSGSQIWDSNRPMLLANLRSWLNNGFGDLHVVDLGIAKDNLSGLETVFKSAFEKVDVLLTSGGVSMGELDLLKPVIKSLGGKIHFGRVAMKPGKPVTFATLPNNKLILAFPGNPASCVVCLHLFGYPLLMKMLGKTNNANEWIEVELGEDVKLDPRPEFQRGTVSQNEDGTWTWISAGFQRSSCVTSMARANSLARLPPATDTLKLLSAGTRVRALFLGVNKGH